MSKPSSAPSKFRKHIGPALVPTQLYGWVYCTCGTTALCAVFSRVSVLSETRAIEIKMVSSEHRASQRSPFPIILALSSSVAL